MRYPIVPACHQPQGTHLHPACLPIEELMKDCDVRRTRRGGPGGQHRNKVETAVVIEHRPTKIIAEASERRSQEQNRQGAIFRLRINLALGFRTEWEMDRRPSALWQSRCTGGKIVVSSEHDDFPALLAEALDAIEAFDMDVRDAAALLECTPSQLTKFLQQEPQALGIVNEARQRLGLRRLR